MEKVSKADELLRNVRGDSIFASMLAEEDITLSYRNVQTASADLTTRHITLPFWRTSQVCNIALKIHEISHMLHTPQEGWHDALTCDHPAVKAAGIKSMEKFKTFLNVLEDARIERMIGSKYPGAKGILNNAHRELFDLGLYNDASGNFAPEELLTIDRVLLLTRIGTNIPGVKFESSDFDFATRANQTETFDDVILLAVEMWEHCGEEMRNRSSRQKNSSMGEKTQQVTDELGPEERNSSGGSEEKNEDGDSNAEEGDGGGQVDQKTGKSDGRGDGSGDEKSADTEEGEDTSGGKNKKASEPTSRLDENHRRNETQILDPSMDSEPKTFELAGLRRVPHRYFKSSASFLGA